MPEMGCGQLLSFGTHQQRRCTLRIYDQVTMVTHGGWVKKVGPFYGRPLNAL